MPSRKAARTTTWVSSSESISRKMTRRGRIALAVPGNSPATATRARRAGFTTERVDGQGETMGGGLPEGWRRGNTTGRRDAPAGERPVKDTPFGLEGKSLGGLSL